MNTGVQTPDITDNTIHHVPSASDLVYFVVLLLLVLSPPCCVVLLVTASVSVCR